MNTKKIIAVVLGLFLLAPSVMHAATTYETSVVKGVNFRTQPSTSGKIVRMLPRGEAVHVIQKQNSYWLKVQTKDGKIGYISSNKQYTNYTATPSKPATTVVKTKADKIIDLSKSLQGKVTYKLGVRNPSKMIFDCSSFVQYVFGQNGVKVSWGTKTMQYEGKAVSKANLKKGDLVFFATTGKSVNHIGIYIGNGKFIHNVPSANGVTISDLTTGYWNKYYSKARRIL